MEDYKLPAVGWIIGYFIALYPLMLITNWTLIGGLAHGIVGLAVAVGILLMKERGDL